MFMFQFVEVSDDNTIHYTSFLDFERIFAGIFDFVFGVDYGGLYSVGQKALVVGQFFGVFFSLLFIILLFYISKKFHKLEEEIEARTTPLAMQAATPALMHNKKWQRVLDHVESNNPGDWRLAVLEGDILLDEMLQTIGAAGDTVAERLKSTNAKTLPSLQLGWEAHLIRNRLAHDGADYELNQREARRVVGLFERILTEGHYL